MMGLVTVSVVSILLGSSVVHEIRGTVEVRNA
jgi:hypothetical protein